MFILHYGFRSFNMRFFGLLLGVRMGPGVVGSPFGWGRVREGVQVAVRACVGHVLTALRPWSAAGLKTVKPKLHRVTFAAGPVGPQLAPGPVRVPAYVPLPSPLRQQALHQLADSATGVGGVLEVEEGSPVALAPEAGRGDIRCWAHRPATGPGSSLKPRTRPRSRATLQSPLRQPLVHQLALGAPGVGGVGEAEAVGRRSVLDKAYVMTYAAVPRRST